MLAPGRNHLATRTCTAWSARGSSGSPRSRRRRIAMPRALAGRSSVEKRKDATVGAAGGMGIDPLLGGGRGAQSHREFPPVETLADNQKELIIEQDFYMQLIVDISLPGITPPARQNKIDLAVVQLWIIDSGLLHLLNVIPHTRIDRGEA